MPWMNTSSVGRVRSRGSCGTTPPVGRLGGWEATVVGAVGAVGVIGAVFGGAVGIAVWAKPSADSAASEQSAAMKQGTTRRSHMTILPGAGQDRDQQAGGPAARVRLQARRAYA